MVRPAGFELSISSRDDGTLEAMYIRIASGSVSKTRELIEDILLADLDGQGNVMGFEILAPVKLSDLAALVEQSRREPFRRFITHTAPPEMVLTGS